MWYPQSWFCCDNICICIHFFCFYSSKTTDLLCLPHYIDGESLWEEPLPIIFFTSASGFVDSLHLKNFTKLWCSKKLRLLLFLSFDVINVSLINDSLKAVTSLSIMSFKQILCYVGASDFSSADDNWCFCLTCVDSPNSRDTHEHLPLVVCTNF